jgi:hypothetical protein
MDRAAAATDSLMLHLMVSESLTKREVCTIIPPLKGSAL